VPRAGNPATGNPVGPASPLSFPGPPGVYSGLVPRTFAGGHARLVRLGDSPGAPPEGGRGTNGDLRVSEQEIEAKVFSIVAEKMGRDRSEIRREMSFQDDLNADSLDQVELVMELEEAFDIEITDEQAEKIKTVADAITHITAEMKTS